MMNWSTLSHQKKNIYIYIIYTQDTFKLSKIGDHIYIYIYIYIYTELGSATLKCSGATATATPTRL